MKKTVLKRKGVFSKGKFNSKLTRALAIAGTCGVIAVTSLTGCTYPSDEVDMVKYMNSTVISGINRSDEVKKELGGITISNFNFTRAEFKDVDDELADVEIYGISRYQCEAQEESAYTALTYTVEKADIERVNQVYKVTAVYILAKAIEGKEPNSISFVKLNDFEDVIKLNKIAKDYVVNNLDEKYRLNDLLVFAIGNFQFDEVNQEVSFETETTVDYKKIASRVLRPGFITSTEYEHSISYQRHRIGLNVSKEEFEQIRSNNALAVKIFIEAFEEGNAEKYSIELCETKKEPDAIIISPKSYRYWTSLSK